MFIADEHTWAEHLFGQAQLGDKRRTQRLLTYAADQARDAAASTLAACQGDTARRLGAYRLLGNPAVDAEAIAEAGFDAVARASSAYDVILALEDTTTLAFSHASARGLGDLSSGSTQQRGWYVHSVLAVSAVSGEIIGLLAQHRWARQDAERGKKHQRKQRPYQDKESFKWQRAAVSVAARLRRLGGDEVLDRVLAICDREADIFDYLCYKLTHRERFVVRAAQDRLLERGPSDGPLHLFRHLQEQPILGYSTVEVAEKGGRRARTARLSVRSAEVVLKVPPQRGPHPVPVAAVYALEEAPPLQEAPLSWLLLTSEAVASLEQASLVLGYYARRPVIEAFHKAWKSGCRVEERRMHSPEALERLVVILAFVAVRLLQLERLSRSSPEASVERVLEAVEWRCLWASTEGGAPPERPPTIAWGLHALGRLAGWQDTQGTGRVGWQTLWKGWHILSERVEGWMLALQTQPQL